MSRSKHKRKRKHFPNINTKGRIIWNHYIRHHYEDGFVSGAHRFSLKNFRKIGHSSIRTKEKSETQKLKFDHEKDYIFKNKDLNLFTMYW